MLLFGWRSHSKVCALVRQCARRIYTAKWGFTYALCLDGKRRDGKVRGRDGWGCEERDAARKAAGRFVFGGLPDRIIVLIWGAWTRCAARRLPACLARNFG